MSYIRNILGALALLPTLTLSHPAAVAAADYLSREPIPETLLTANLERLMGYVIDDPTARITLKQILGREPMGNGKSRVWFCIEVKRGEYEPVTNCGADARLIRLDTNRWIIQHTTAGAWLVVEQ